MRNRLRFIAALLALLALTVSVAEQAWAAACMSMDGSSPMTSVASEAGSPHAAGGHGSPAPGEDRSHPPSDAGSCPMAAASGMACGVAALPVDAPPAPFGSEIHMAVPSAADEAPGSLALSSLFRPPRR